MEINGQIALFTTFWGSPKFSGQQIPQRTGRTRVTADRPVKLAGSPSRKSVNGYRGAGCLPCPSASARQGPHHPLRARYPANPRERVRSGAVETTPAHPDSKAGRPSVGSTRTTDWRRRWRIARPWLGTAFRIVVGVVFIVAGGLKVGDLAGSGRAVNAYDVMPIELGRLIGAALPLVEIALGLLLVVGLASRLAAAATAMLFVVFITGITQAWARGLTIDCGCFGEGGPVAANQTKYAWEIGRDIFLLAAAAFIVIFPRTKYSLDARLAGPEEIE